MAKNYKVIALIVAGGSGTRMGSEIPKQYMSAGSTSILEKSILMFKNNRLIDNICVVIANEHEWLFKDILDRYPEIIFCTGGKTRQDSVKNGLEKIKEYGPDKVLIHDAARPFVSDNIIERVLTALSGHKAVIPAVSVKDTIKSSEKDLVEDTLDRTKLYAAQTPQGFDFKTIYELHKKYKGKELTDDSALAEKDGIKVKLVQGEYANYKITTIDDLKMNKTVRIGNGFDVHAFEEGDGVIMAGVKIPFNKKLKGHSDADCAWHALTDAILGAIGEGDIGEHFPDSDKKWKGADSSIFLKHSVELVKKKGGVINNADITIICEQPKMKDHKTAMKKKTAEILGISEECINVKATTTEQMGFLGRKEGVAVLTTVAISI